MFFLFENILFLFAGTRLLLIAAAVIPAVILLIKIYRADRLEKESGRLLIKLITLGILSTVGAIIFENIGDLVLELFVDLGLIRTYTVYNLLEYVLVVGLSEEFCKYVLLKKGTWRSPEFNCRFDGVVYATFVSLGFALAENIGYVTSYGLGTALIRAVTAIPGHASFGVFMGVFYGLARQKENAGQPAEAKKLRRLAVLIPALFHGLYDFIATGENGVYTIAFLIYVLIMFSLAFRLVRQISSEDHYITQG